MSNSALFEHICLKNINKLYQHAGKCDDQQQFKDFIETPMVSTNVGFTHNSPISPMNPTPVKKPSDTKSLCLFTNNLDARNKTAIRRVRSAKSKRKEVKAGTILGAKKKAKRKFKKQP